MKEESKLEKIKGYMPLIVTRNYVQGLKNEIEQTEKQSDGRQILLEKETKKKEQLQNDIKQFEIIKNKEIERLESKISSQNETLEATLKEKEEKSLENIKLRKKVAALQKNNQEIGNSKGGVVSANHKLKSELDAKNQVINEYKILVEELERKNNSQEEIIQQLQRKNEVQASKIQEFSKNQEHESLEYQEDGLPKQTKDVLSKRKFRRKKNK